MAVELAAAYVSIIPSTRGLKSALTGQMAPQMDAAGKEAGGILGGALTTAAVGAAVGVGAAIGGVAAKGLSEFSSLESGLNEVFTLLPGITQNAMGEMTDEVRTFAQDFKVLPDDVVPALYQSLSAGVPPGNVFEFLEVANQAAVGGVTDLTTSVDGISSVVNAYKDQIGGAAEASDLMFTAVRLGKTNFEELSSSLSNVIPTAAANNVAFGDVAASLATLTAQGVPTAQATTQVRAALVEMADSGTVVGKTFEDVAGTSFKKFMAEGGNLGDALGLIQGEAEDTGVPIEQLFGSVEAGSAVLGLTGANADSFSANLDEMANSAGATDAAYEQMDQGLARTWEGIQATFAVGLTEIGEALAPVAQQFGDWFADKLPAAIDVAVGVFEGAVDTFTRVFDAFRDGESTLDSIQDAILAAFNLDPDISLLQVVQDAFVALFDNVAGFLSGGGLDVITGALQDVFFGIVDWLNSGGISTIVEAILAGRERLFEAALELFPVLLDALIVAFPSVIQWLANVAIPELVSVITTAVPVLLAEAETLFGVILDAIVLILPEIIAALVDDLLPAILGALTTMLPVVLEAALGLFQSLVTAVVTVLPTILDALFTTVLPALLNAIVTMVPALLEAALGLFGQLADAIVTILPTVVDLLLGTVLPALITTLLDMVPSLLETAIATFLSLVDAVLEVLPMLVETLLGTLLPGLIVALIGMVPQLLASAIELFTSLVTGVLEVLPTLIETLLADVLPVLLLTIVEMAPELLLAAVEAFTALVEALTEILPELITTMATEVLPALVMALVEMYPDLIDAANEAFYAIAEGLIESIPDLLSAFAGLQTKLYAAIDEIPAKLYEAGKNAIGSLIEGMTGVDVSSAMSGIADKVRRYWPFSPAKEGPLKKYPMDQAGRNVVSMLADGMRSQVGRVEDASSAIASAALSDELSASFGATLPNGVASLPSSFRVRGGDGSETPVRNGPTINQNFYGDPGGSAFEARQGARMILRSLGT